MRTLKGDEIRYFCVDVSVVVSDFDTKKTLAHNCRDWVNESCQYVADIASLNCQNLKGRAKLKSIIAINSAMNIA